MTQAVERHAALLSPDLKAVLPGIAGRGARVARGGYRDHQQSIVHRGHSFGQSLGECELRVEVAGGKRSLAACHGQAASVGHPFIDQDQDRTEPAEQLHHLVAGIGGVAIVVGHHPIPLHTSQLVGDVAPHGPDFDVSHRQHGRRRRSQLSGEHRPPHLLWDRQVVLLQRLTHSRQTGPAGGQVVESDQAVRLSATEPGLKLHHRVATLPGQA